MTDTIYEIDKFITKDNVTIKFIHHHFVVYTIAPDRIQGVYTNLDDAKWRLLSIINKTYNGYIYEWVDDELISTYYMEKDGDTIIEGYIDMDRLI